MRAAYDFSPLYGSIVGVDHMAGLIENAMAGPRQRDYPPYDIEKTGDNAYRITLSTAGFRSEELEVTAMPNVLVVTGAKADEDRRGTYLHRGLAQRAFEHRFELADHVVVKEARYADGLLTIDLVREVPEPLKPRRVEIKGRSDGVISRLVDRKRGASKAA